MLSPMPSSSTSLVSMLNIVYHFARAFAMTSILALGNPSPLSLIVSL
jgi:hypothetical protein